MDINESLEWIRAYAQNQRDAGMQVIAWKMDAWKAELGMVEVAGPAYKLWDVDNRPTRTLRRGQKEEVEDRPFRYVPLMNGYGILVREWE